MTATLAPAHVDSDATRETRHLAARTAQEFHAWQQWLELGGFNSCDAYARTVAALMIRHPAKAMGELTPDDVAAALIGYPAKSRRIRKAHLNSWFSWGYRTQRIPTNPVDFLPRIKRHPQPVIDVFTEAEQAALEGLPLPDGPLMTLMFEAGLRVSEARMMRAERLDFTAGMVVVKEGAKRGKDRLVPMMPQLAGAMDRLLTEEGLGPKDHLWYDKPGGGFATKVRRSKPIASTSFGRWWYRCLDDAEVAYVKRDPQAGVTGRGNPHAARHTYATRWKNRGIDLKDLSDNLGHASVAITADLYVHTGATSRAEKMRALLEVEN